MMLTKSVFVLPLPTLVPASFFLDYDRKPTCFYPDMLPSQGESLMFGDGLALI